MRDYDLDKEDIKPMMQILNAIAGKKRNVNKTILNYLLLENGLQGGYGGTRVHPDQ